MHHLGTSNPPGSPIVSKKVFLSLYSDMLEAAQDLMGRSPRQSQFSALLLSVLLFIQELLPLLLLPILPTCSLSPLWAGTLPHIHTHYGYQAPALGYHRIPVPPPDCAPSEEQV